MYRMGATEFVIILAIILLLFGPRVLPRLFKKLYGVVVDWIIARQNKSTARNNSDDD